VRIVDDIDILDPDVTGPAHIQVWSRIPGAPDDLALAQAMAAYASDGLLIATAMRLHEGVGQSMAHVSVATTVLTQTLTFHDPFAASDWLLFDQHSTYAGRGRSHGVAQIFDASGTLVASSTQDNMIRAMV
jgi:acyl-CoA thioesterase-2